jgi:hypothetical protein
MFPENKRLTNTADGCISEESLHAYLLGRLAGGERAALEAHVSRCDFCRKKLVMGFKNQKTRSHGTGLSRNALRRLYARVNASGVAQKSFFTRHIWGVAMLGAFLASFFFKRYFLQWLVAALVLGFKWVFESENLKSFIMVLESRFKAKNSDRQEHGPVRKR